MKNKIGPWFFVMGILNYIIKTITFSVFPFVKVLIRKRYSKQINL